MRWSLEAPRGPRACPLPGRSLPPAHGPCSHALCVPHQPVRGEKHLFPSPFTLTPSPSPSPVASFLRQLPAACQAAPSRPGLGLTQHRDPGEHLCDERQRLCPQRAGERDEYLGSKGNKSRDGNLLGDGGDGAAVEDGQRGHS